MANDKKNSFPKMAPKNWWGLRERFKKTIPSTVDTTYIASTLKMSADSARSNVLAPLRLVGLIDEQGKPTDLANKWRNDAQYPEVCQGIIKNVYPQSLIDAFSDPKEDTSGVEAWFMHECRVGEPAAKMFTSFYSLLCEGDVNKADDILKNNNSSKPAKPASPKKTSDKSTATRSEKAEPVKQPEAQPKKVDYTLFPSLHVDIQIHIAPETTAEQIDKVFASMAKHFRSLQTPSNDTQ